MKVKSYIVNLMHLYEIKTGKMMTYGVLKELGVCNNNCDMCIHVLRYKSSGGNIYTYCGILSDPKQSWIRYEVKNCPPGTDARLYALDLIKIY